MKFESQPDFHPAIRNWFAATFSGPTPAQAEAWPAIQSGRHTLIAAPTGSGKTLAAFLAALDGLVREGLERGLPDQTQVLYVSPLRALSNDIEKNLRAPLCGIADELNALGLPPVPIRVMVRTGDTTTTERNRMRREPPHVLVTTPESLFILLTSQSGRDMLRTVRTVIVDEIHALAGNKRGSHLALSLERLEALIVEGVGLEAPTPGRSPTRIGLSATQRPLETVAQFLIGGATQNGVGARAPTPSEINCTIVDCGHVRRRDLALELPDSPLEAVMATEVWTEVHDRLAQLVREHRTTLIFTNTRRMAERLARHLGERLGDENVTSHHGSLAREHRLDAEQRLKGGKLQALVATASLELGIDIGDVDLVCQVGSPRGIAVLLQRVGRSGHFLGGTPKGRLFPLTRDELLECTALLDAVRRDELDELRIPPGHLDVLAQQIVAEAACRDWSEDDLFHLCKGAFPYRGLPRTEFDAVLAMLGDGFSTRRGRRSRYVQRDAVNGIVRGRPGARLTAVTNAGAIPDQFDYDVLLEPDGHLVGTVNEDFAFESLPGDIFQLGNTSYRVRKVEQGRLRVEDAKGQPPNMPFWLGEAPGRSDELSLAVSRLRATMNELLPDGEAAAQDWLISEVGLQPAAATQLTLYLSATRAALGLIPTQRDIVFERFFDEAGDQHLVVHSCFGSRLNRAWGLGLRKRFCRKFNFELQAAALEDTIVISLGATHSFPLEDVSRYLHSNSARDVVTQALLAVPMFPTHWRWNASIALAIRRMSGGKRVPPQFQRTDAEDLIAVVFPDQLACQDNLTGEREIPKHPLVDQTIYDCLHEVMDITGLVKLLADIERGHARVHVRDLSGPSPLAQEILTARPYAFLDDAPAEERRTRAVAARNFADPLLAGELARLDPQAIDEVRRNAWPDAADPEELHDALLLSGIIDESELGETRRNLPAWREYLQPLIAQRRATIITVGRRRYWGCAERLAQVHAVFASGALEPEIAAAGPMTTISWTPEAALVELLRARLECVGPISESELATFFGLPAGAIQSALAVLEQEGFAMRGRFTGGADTEWCERALLARIHRATLATLRREIEPVTAQQFMRFLFAWHGLGSDRAEGDAALAAVLGRLEGFAMPAAAWEADVLPARLQGYTSNMLDRLCASGRILWARLAANPGADADGALPRTSVLRNTPVVLINRAAAPVWLGLNPPPHSAHTRGSAAAQKILALLRARGALFFLDLVQQSGLLRTQVEEALAELAANGLVTSDSFAGLRALILPATRRPGYRRRRGAGSDSVDDAGRWSLVPSVETPAREAEARSGWLATPLEVLDHVVDVLLQRYGVLFRRLLERESVPPWRELLYVLRRREARGEVRGGRFVAGFSGEQFALPEAVGLLRRQRDAGSGDLHAVSAADPLNLSGILLPGARIPASSTGRIVFRDGVPIAMQSRGDIGFLAEVDNALAWQVRGLFARRRNPSGWLPAPRQPV
ncbi:MAG: DEAD/DEAH box helicase [Gammaproteobacteria bacterium]|nr:DEAD/DEAH box helicase [Gammaproteobacteria bacterium]